MNILGVTLARGGSKGIPLKNIATCAGRPLIDWTLREAYQVQSLTEYVVVSDCEAIMWRVNLRRADFFLEPAVLASDTATSTDALRWAVARWEQFENTTVDIVVELMATNPLKTAADIQACIDLLVDDPTLDSVIAVAPLGGHHPMRAKRVTDEGLIVDWCEHTAEVSSRRQDLPPAYVRASAIYALRREALFSVGRFGHERSKAYVLPPERGVGIDTMADLKAAEWYLEQREEQASEDSMHDED